MAKAVKKQTTRKAIKKTNIKRKAAGAGLLSVTAAAAHASQTGKKYFKSLPEGTWIECDWDPAQQIYDNCHKVPASQVPKAWGGDGP